VRPRPRISVKAGLLAAATSFVVGVPLQFALRALHVVEVPWDVWAWVLGSAAVVAGVLTGLFVHVTITRRMIQVSQILDTHLSGNDLLRVPHLGDDELGALAGSINRLCAALTSTQARLLEERLSAPPEDVSAHHDRTLELLLAITRAAARADSPEGLVEDVADALAETIAPRELAIFLRDESEGGAFRVRAARGFDDGGALIGRPLGDGEDIAGVAASTGQPTFVEDARREPGFVALWDLAPKTGTFAAIPILHGDQAIGILVATRPTERDLTSEDRDLLRAAADQIAVGLRATGAG